MKLLSIVLGQSIRLIRFSHPSGGAYMPDLVGALQGRYGFVEIPKTLDEFDDTKGITFSHGKFVDKRKSFVIDRFQIFNNGLLASSRSRVENLETFLDDVIDWASKDLGVTVVEIPPVRKVFFSQLEVQLHSNVNSLVGKTKALATSLRRRLNQYGTSVPAFEISTLALHCDTTGLQFPMPSAFSIERRNPYSSNVFLSSAPLLTEDHMKLLNQLETLAKR